MTTRDIVSKDMYDADVSPTVISAVTNAIESLNSVIRKSTKTRKIFPHDNSALKVVYLSCEKACRKWTMPIRNWKPYLKPVYD